MIKSHVPLTTGFGGATRHTLSFDPSKIWTKSSQQSNSVPAPPGNRNFAPLMTTPQPCASTSQESNSVPDSSGSNSGASTGTLSQLISSQETNSVPVFSSVANDKAQEAMPGAGSIASPNISGDSNSNLFGVRSSLIAAIRQVFSREATALRQVETLLHYLKIVSLD